MATSSPRPNRFISFVNESKIAQPGITNIKLFQTVSNPTTSKLPIIQRIVCRDSVKVEKNCINITTAAYKKLATTPAKSSLPVATTPPTFEIEYTNNIVSMEKMKAEIETIENPKTPIARPDLIAKRAPRDAPPDIPNVNGDASGFLKRA